MISTLTTRAKENSTYVITVTFTDEDGDAVVPTSITWSLTDKSGNVINDREDVAVAVPASSVDVVLSGADLAVGTATAVQRYFLVEATYNSDLGTGLPLNDECIFLLDGLVEVP